MLTIIFQFVTLKMIWIFLFVVNCIMTFLMAVYNNDIEELKRSILPETAQPDVEQEDDSKQTLEEQLQTLMDKLCHTERLIKSEIKNGEKILSNTDNKSVSRRDVYKSLITDLKRDIRITEEEVKGLQDKVSNLCMRRLGLKNEVVKQQEDYQKMLDSIDKELEGKSGEKNALTFFSDS